MARTWTVVVYGATGFTGRLIAKYLARHAPSGTTFALAGRTEGKLLAIRDSLAPELAESGTGRTTDDIGIIVADADDGEAINALTKATEVVIAAAGPFAKCGFPLARAAACNGTHYADITGEAPYVRDVIDKCGKDARDSGAVLVPMAGFDSVPSDIGTLFTVDALRKRFGCATKTVRCLARTKGGGMSGGTIATGLHMMSDASASRRLRDPLCLVPPDLGAAADTTMGSAAAADTTGPAGSRAVKGDTDRWTVSWVEEAGVFAAPWPMEAINTRCVRRSAALAAAAGSPYSATEPFSYREWLSIRSLWAAVMVAASSLLMRIIAMLPFAPTLLALVVPKPGSGPSDEEMARSTWEMVFLATPDVEPISASSAGAGASVLAAAPTVLTARVRGSTDAYVSTAVSVCEAAFALAERGGPVPGTGGVFTPAAAFDTDFIRRLEATGTFSFTVDGDSDRS